MSDHSPQFDITVAFSNPRNTFEVAAKYGHPYLRNGQIAYNELRSSERGKIAMAVMGSKIDPYYADSNLPAFWECVKEKWDQ